MIALAMEGRDLRRWILSAVAVIGIHAALVATFTKWHESAEGDQGTEPILVDLTPFVGTQTDTKNDLAPGPVEQQPVEAPPVQPTKPAEAPKEKVEPQVSPDADVQLPSQEEEKPTNKEIEQPRPPLIETAPPRRRPSAAQVASWHRKIVLQIERHKGYPATARARHETGVAELGFSIDRQGRVVASHIVRSSGYASLDLETISTIKRAQPFPPPPPNMPGDRFDFTLPIKFNIR